MKQFFLASTLLFLVAGCDALGGDDEPPANLIPNGDFTFTPQNPRAGQAVTFTANAMDTDGQVVGYSWDFDGDGQQDASGASPSWEFDRLGTYSVSLTVTDDRGGTDIATRSVSVSQRFNQARVTSVTVVEMPFVDQNGVGWDIGNGPDVYFGAYNASNQPLSFSGIFADVVPGHLPLTFSDGDFTISNLSERVSIILWDRDPTGDENMGGIIFDLSREIGSYPATLNLDAGAGIVFDIALTWSFAGEPAP